MSAGPLLAGVVGWPIGHSRSPRLHGHWLHRYGIDGHYIPVALQPGRVEAGFRALMELGFRGVNVTLPHKEEALALAAIVTPRAQAIGAANTLVFRDGAIEADNTDAYGFLENLRDAVPDWSAEAGPALVLGAGGASRAILYALLEGGAPDIWVANRTFSRAERLAEHFGTRVKPLPLEDLSEVASSAATVVNTTAAGLHGETVPLDLGLLRADVVVSDIVYGAEPTAFVAAAQARGLRAVDGLGMLLHQAVPGFEAWFGRRPVVDDALRAAVLAP